MNQKSINHKPKQGQNWHHTNFIEALKNAGGDIARDLKSGVTDDLFKGSVKQAGETVFRSSSPTQDQQANNLPQKDIDFEEYLYSAEKAKNQRQLDVVKREYEQKVVEIYDREKEATKKKIEEIKFELKQLKVSMQSVEQSTQTVIAQEEVDPGTYHLSLLEKVLSLLKKIHKSMRDSRYWSQMQQQRCRTKSYYWSKVKNSGTKFMLSQERQLATQTG